MALDPARPESGGNPDALARACAATMYADDLAVRAVGIVVSDVTSGRATARMAVTENMINGHDICHGGYVFLLADTAFAYACNSHGEVTVAAGGDVVSSRPRASVSSSSRRRPNGCARVAGGCTT